MSLTMLVLLLLTWALVGMVVALVTGRVLRLGVGEKSSEQWTTIARRKMIH